VIEKELKSLIDKTILPACKGVLYGKGRAYSGVRKAKDCLANFKRGALLTGLKVEQVCFIYLAKHFDAIASWTRGEYKDDTEGIESRIIDAINYLFLLYAIKIEKDKENKKEKM